MLPTPVPDTPRGYRVPLFAGMERIRKSRVNFKDLYLTALGIAGIRQHAQAGERVVLLSAGIEFIQAFSPVCWLGWSRFLLTRLRVPRTGRDFWAL